MWLALSSLGCTAPTSRPEPASDSGAPQARLTGTIADDRGPIPDLVLQACADVCVAGFTATDGRFALSLSPGRWALKVVPDDAGHAPAVLPLDVDADRDVALTLPLLGDPAPVGADGQVHPAPGLTLDASAGALGVDAVAAAPIALAGGGTPLDGVAGEPVAGWWLAPAGVGADVPFTAALPDGTAWGAAWCTSVHGDGWSRCDDGRLPTLGGLVLTR